MKNNDLKEVYKVIWKVFAIISSILIFFVIILAKISPAPSGSDKVITITYLDYFSAVGSGFLLAWFIVLIAFLLVSIKIWVDYRFDKHELIENEDERTESVGIDKIDNANNNINEVDKTFKELDKVYKKIVKILDENSILKNNADLLDNAKSIEENIRLELEDLKNIFINNQKNWDSNKLLGE